MNTANDQPTNETVPGELLTQAGRSLRPARSLSQAFFGVARWLHIYLSMFGFATILFFSVTGITLNHPGWFGGPQESVEQLRGTLDQHWLGDTRAPDSAQQVDSHLTDDVDRLRVAETLRKTHGIRGTVTEFRVDDEECTVTFEGPAYGADVLINRQTGEYDLSVTRHGLVALINDLHKGRDSGDPWAIVIDVSAVLMIISSVTGLALLFSIRRKRVAGLVTALAGTLVLWCAYAWLVP